MTDKIKEPEILDNGIKVYLGDSWWILFAKSWSNMDTTRFRNSADMPALKLLINKVVDWSVPSENWEPLKFEKDKLLAQIDAFIAYQDKIDALREQKKYAEITREPMPECFAIPNQIQIAMSTAFYTAAGASYKCPFVST